MKFTLEIDSDNAAVDDHPRVHVSELVHRSALKLLTENHGTIIDINGNTVGHWTLEEETDNE